MKVTLSIEDVQNKAGNTVTFVAGVDVELILGENPYIKVTEVIADLGTRALDFMEATL